MEVPPKNFLSMKSCNFQYYSINKLPGVHMMKIMKKPVDIINRKSDSKKNDIPPFLFSLKAL